MLLSPSVPAKFTLAIGRSSPPVEAGLGSCTLYLRRGNPWFSASRSATPGVEQCPVAKTLSGSASPGDQRDIHTTRGKGET